MQSEALFFQHTLLAAALLDWAPLRCWQEEEGKNTSTITTYKTFRWGWSLAWADRFGYILGICFHSTLNFIKIQIMKLDDIELGKQILYDFTLPEIWHTILKTLNLGVFYFTGEIF